MQVGGTQRCLQYGAVLTQPGLADGADRFAQVEGAA
jgi:hypothetical protein